MTTGLYDKLTIDELKALYPGLSPEALVWLSQHPENIPSYNKTPSQLTLEGFQRWLPIKYSPEEIEVIEQNPNDYLQFYVDNIQGTRWDVVPAGERGSFEYYQSQERGEYRRTREQWERAGKPTLPPGRPQPEKYGISEQDWQVLGENPQVWERELKNWFQSGYINEYQVRDILEELPNRSRQAQIQAVYGEDPEDRGRRLRQLEFQRYTKRMGRYKGPINIPQTQIRPFTDYGVGLERLRAGFEGEVPQTENWRDWFRSTYPKIIEQFEAKPAEQRTEKTWTEYLKKRKPEIKEQRYKQTPYERGERPSYYAPRVQTVKF